MPSFQQATERARHLQEWLNSRARGWSWMLGHHSEQGHAALDYAFDGGCEWERGPAVPRLSLDLDCVPVGERLHVFGVSEDGHLWHTIRHAPGDWQPFEDMADSADDGGRLRAVACADDERELHVCVVTGDGMLWHTSHHDEAEGWGLTEDAAIEGAEIVNVGIAAQAGKLHVCTATSDGRLWYAVRYVGGEWSHFEDMTRLARIRPGLSFTDVDCAHVNRGLYVCAVTADGRLWATHRPDDARSWEPFEEVRDHADEYGAIMSVACGDGPSGHGTQKLYACLTTRATGEQRLYHAGFVRKEGISNEVPYFWGQLEIDAQPFGQGFVKAALGERAGLLHVCGLSGDGHLWYTRPPRS